jgi:Arc/MetJ-type ribon-helix-helix transcriptional regulator
VNRFDGDVRQAHPGGVGITDPQADPRAIAGSAQSLHDLLLPHRSVKLSISLTNEDVALLDEYVRTSGLASRSAAMQHAVRRLRHPELEQDYEAAWDEWSASDEQRMWDGTAADGLADAAR